MADNLLSIRDVAVRFGGLLALDGVSFDVSAGEIIGIIGPNGAGKTTLFNVLSRIARPHRGTIRIGDADLLHLRPDQVIGAGITRTFQNVEVFPRLTVLEHVLIGLTPSIGGGVWACGFRLPAYRRAERDARDRAFATLAELGLAGDADRLAVDLPYGRLKLLEIARAMVSSPRIILLDEPMAGLSRQEKQAVLRVLLDIHARVSVAFLLVEHDMQVVMDTVERVIVLDYGQKIAEGRPDEVRRDERVLAAYLGDTDVARA